MNRIVVIGAAGSGKTTLAFRLAAKMNCAAIDLDELHWKPGWVEAGNDEFRQAVDQATTGNQWVAAGNYGKVRDVLWNKADTLIWLDYSLLRSFNQLARRSVSRILNKTEICNGNTESLKKLFSKDSIILWLFASHAHHKKDFESIFANPAQNPQIKNFIRLRNPQETEQFVASLK